MEKSHEAVHHPVELEKDIEEVFNGTTTFTSSALSELEINNKDSSPMIKFKLKVTKLDGTIVVSPYLILSRKNTLRFVIRRACKDLDMKDCTLTIEGYDDDDKLDWTVEQAGIQDNDVLTAEEVPVDTTVKGRIRSSISLSRRNILLTGLLLLLGLVIVATVALCVFFALHSKSSKSDHPNNGVDFSEFQDNNHTVLYHMEQDFWDVQNVFTISNSQDETDFYTVKASAIPARSNHLILLNPTGQQVLTLDEVLSADNKETYEIRTDKEVLVGRVTKQATTSGSLGDAFSLESLHSNSTTTYYDIQGSLGIFHYKFSTQQDTTTLVAEMYKVYEASWTEQYDAYQVMIDTRHSVELILLACVVIDMIAHNNAG